MKTLEGMVENALDRQVNIGDLESQEKGSAARKNAGKARWCLMPLRQIALMMWKLRDYEEVEPPSLHDLTLALSVWQEQGTYEIALRVLEEGYRYLMHVTGTNFDEASKQVINVWELGEEKYATYNWMKGMPWTELLNSAQRHVIHMLNGNQLDEDSGEHHAAHFICNAMMMVHYTKHYPEGNDLPIKWFK